MTPAQDYSEIRQHIGKLIQIEPPERLEYIKKHGVEIYIVPVKNSTQNNFETLPWAPKKFARLLAEFADGSTAGLYLTPANASYDVVKPTILIAQDAEPWALIHEFVHALLDEVRVKESTLNETTLVLRVEDAREDLNESWWSYKSKNSLSSEELSHMMIAFVTVAQLDAQLLKAIQLEEILIEGLLRQAYKFYMPLDFKAETYEFSAVYIKMSAQKAQIQLSGILDKCPEIMALAIRDRSFMMTNVVKACLDAQDLQAEIQHLKDAAL